MKHFLKMTTAVMLFAPASYGDTFTDAVVAKYRDMLKISSSFERKRRGRMVA